MTPGFTFVVEGQPPSWNRAYRIVKQKLPDGKMRAMLMKTAEAEALQLIAKNACNRAMPRGWAPPVPYDSKLGLGMVVIEFDFFLVRDIDCDNVMKLINDAIKWAIGLDDDRFLPRAMSKRVVGAKGKPRVEVSLHAPGIELCACDHGNAGTNDNGICTFCEHREHVGLCPIDVPDRR